MESVISCNMWNHGLNENHELYEVIYYMKLYIM